MAKSAKTAKSKAPGKAEIETYKHKEAKRKNIPTAENQKLIADDDKAIKKLRWPRNPDLDPQLIWRGKDVEPDPLEVDAPPIYIQEKIKPQAIVDDLRKQTKERTKDAAPQFDFFHDFNGLPEGWKEDATQSYYHDEGNWSNRMILGNSLLVMASLAEREGLRGKVQCIYFDPPYGIKFNSNWQPTTNRRDVKDANLNSVSREPEVIRAFRDTWTDGVHSYLGHFRDRIVAARDMLHQSGSIFVQIGDGNVHRVRAVLDEVFGDKNFVSLITVLKTSGAGSPAIGTNVLASVADYIVCYAKDLRAIKYRQIFLERKFGEEGASQYVYLESPDGSEVRSLSEKEKQAPKTIPAEWHIMAHDNLTSQTGVETTQVSVSYASREFSPNKGGWKTNALGLSRLEKASRFLVVGNTLRYRRRFNDFNQRPINDVWSDFRTSGFSDPKMYVVQTNPGIVARCVLMSTDPGDLVLDPTCGSGTTAYVAEQWGRRWITIDTSRVVLTLARARLMGSKYDYYLLKDSKGGAEKEGELTGKPPAGGPFTNNVRHSFVYERAPHVTLKSIANNAEIDVIWERWQKMLEPLRQTLNKAVKQSWDEWQIPREAGESWSIQAKAAHEQWWDERLARQKEIDESIARNAEVEYLYDRPYKARGVVRVAGPFTVESLSPHRVLPMGEDPYLEELLAAGEEASSIIPGAGKKDVDGRDKPGHDEKSGPVITDFAQVVYENLKAGRGAEHQEGRDP